jgi:hypothetical protein
LATLARLCSPAAGAARRSGRVRAGSAEANGAVSRVKRSIVAWGCWGLAPALYPALYHARRGGARSCAAVCVCSCAAACVGACAELRVCVYAVCVRSRACEKVTFSRLSHLHILLGSRDIYASRGKAACRVLASTYVPALATLLELTYGEWSRSGTRAKVRFRSVNSGNQLIVPVSPRSATIFIPQTAILKISS